MNESELRRVLKAAKENYRKIQSESVASGAKGIAGTIYDKCNQNNKTSDEIVSEIKEFCEIGLGIRKN